MECLVVDDSTTVRKIAGKIVENLGLAVREAEDGVFACDECKKEMPDVILLDWNMPNMNGLEFLKSLRAMENGSKPKVIFCTTENGMDFIQDGMGAGADEYIMKPFDETIIQSKFIQLGIIQEDI